MRYHAFPQDVAELIVEHWCAMRIQRRWLRFHHFAHARHPLWPEIRARLNRIDAWKDLIPFPQVRYEWRVEPESWCYTDLMVVHAIRLEATESRLWGAPTCRLLTPSCVQAVKWAARTPTPRAAPPARTPNSVV